MRSRHREFLNKDDNPLVRMFQRFLKFAEGGPTVPWLPRDTNLASIRRTAVRLRSGAIRPPHPSIDPHAAAWVLDRAVEQQLVVLETVADAESDKALRGDGASRKHRERLLRRRAAFHRLKVAARDPESDAAEKFRRLDRERRRGLGWPGQRRGDESESARPRRQIRLPLTFVVGNAQHVFLGPYGTNLDEALEAYFPEQFRRSEHGDPWCSAPMEWCGWNDLQERVVAALGSDAVPHLLNTAANKGVFLSTGLEPCTLSDIDGNPSARLAIGDIGELIEELERFGTRCALPTDDAALMELPEKLGDFELALLTYAQVLRAAHYAAKTRIPLWAVRNTWPIEPRVDDDDGD